MTTRAHAFRPRSRKSGAIAFNSFKSRFLTKAGIEQEECKSGEYA